MKHAELIARLEAAEAGSQGLDEDVHDAIGIPKTRQCIAGLSGEDGGLWMYCFEGGEPQSAFRCTTSLDAALALALRVLPDVQFNMATGVMGGLPWVQCYPFPQEEDNYLDAEVAATLPVALCIAILKALEAQ